MSESPFQFLQKDFCDHVNLDVLVPLLNRKRLLTRDEEYQLLNNDPPGRRAMKLTQILSSKGPDAPQQVLDCLRAEKQHAGHAHLARLMEQEILRQGGFSSRTSTFDFRGPPPSQLAGDSSAGSNLASTSQAYVRRDTVPLASDQVLRREPSLLVPPQTPGGDDHAASSESRVQLYPLLISELSLELTQTPDIQLHTVTICLSAMLSSAGVQCHIPNTVSDFPSLFSFLHERRMCHELDVDILCMLFSELQHRALWKRVYDYAMTLFPLTVTLHPNPDITPLQGYMLAFSHHSTLQLTMGQVYQIKDFLSNLLGLPRHAFTFVACQTGSLTLVWQLPRKYHSGRQSSFRVSAVKSGIADSDLLPVSVDVHDPSNSVIVTQFTQSDSPEVSDLEVDCSILVPGHPVSKDIVSSVSNEIPHLIFPHPGKGSDPRGPTISSITPFLDTSCVESNLMEVTTASRKRPSCSKEKGTSTPFSPPPPPKRNKPSENPKSPSSYLQTREDFMQHQDVCASVQERFQDTSPQQFAGQYVVESFSDAQEEQCNTAIHPLKKHQPQLLKLIDLPSLVPYLNKHELLTDTEEQTLLNENLPHQKRVMELLGYIQRKGDTGYVKFMKAIAEEPQHLGHKAIAKEPQHLGHKAIAEEPHHLGHRDLVKALPTGTADPLSVLRETLKCHYTSRGFYYGTAGPNIGRPQYIRLALIKKQRASENDKQHDKFLRDSLHGLVDDITHKKEEIEREKIFDYRSLDEHGRKVVLVEGAPGIGKTMLSKKICEGWARGEILQEYELVVLVLLRTFQGAPKLGVKDLVKLYLSESRLAEQTTDAILKTIGEKVLLIFEGWDELSPKLREDYTFFFEVIKGQILPRASVMVTSRSTVTSTLYDYMDERRIEVLGFSPHQAKQFVQEHVKGSRADMILEHLNKFPNLKALAHIPLTLSIICHVAQLRGSLPQTLTELYGSYICSVLFQNLRKRESIQSIHSISELPNDVRKIVHTLGRLALEGFEDRQYVFGVEDLQSMGLEVKDQFDGHGLLSTFPKATEGGAGYEILYQFRHLSIQEFLAALEIEKLSPDAQIKLVRCHRKNKQFQNIWKFLSGITQLKNEELRHVIISETNTKSSLDQLFLLHCTYEAADVETSGAVAAKLNRTLNLDNMILNTTDCLCIAHTMASSGGEWHIDFRGCNIGAEGMEVIKTHLIAHATTELKIGTLHLRHNRLDVIALGHLAEMIKSSIPLRDINLGTNEFGDEGAKIVAEALEENKTVKFMHLSYCKVTRVGAQAFARMLTRNATLNNLFFGFESLGDDGVSQLALALTQNSSLTELSLSSTGLGSGALQQLAQSLKVNETLEVLRLDRNELGPQNCGVIADMIGVAKKLILIDLSKNPIGDEGFCVIMDTLIANPKCSLKKLGVFGCEITSKGIKKLVELFKITDKFEGLTLGNNPLGDEGAKILAAALQANTARSVKDILLEGVGFSEEGKKLIEEACKEFEAFPVSYEFHAQLKKKPLPMAT